MMLAVHGVWGTGSRLLLWAEDPTLPATAPARRGHPPKTPRPRRHPFAASVLALEELFGAAVGKAGETTLLLPSLDSGPAGSPQLLRSEPGSAKGVPMLVAWRIPALVIEPGPAVDLLLALSDDRVVGLTVGESMRFLARTAEFALDLVTRGRVLPALVRRRSGFDARWRPVLGGVDVDRMRALGATMPGLCRAEVTKGHPTGRTTTDVLRDILESATDDLVRSSLPTGTLLPARRGRRPVGEPVAAEGWITALAGDEASVAGDPGELDKLATVLDEWRRSAAAASGRVRVCFRLEPPAETESEDDWRVEFLLQAVDDPSLLLPAADVWAAGPTVKAWETTVEHPQERLLEGLGRASRLWPALEQSLGSAHPDGLALDSAGAVAFLRDAAPLLEQVGFGVQVPGWWRSGRHRLGARLKATTRKQSAAAGETGLGMDALLRYRWEVALGDNTLTAAELRELARLKQPLVRVRGQWVELRQEDIAAALALTRRPNTGDDGMTAGDVLRTAIGLGPVSPGLPIVGVEADGWVGDLLAGAVDRRLQAVSTPTGFDGQLRPYQERGLAWLSFLGGLGLGACLADDMGLGKTAQLLALVVSEQPAPTSRKARAHRLRPTLVVCPMSLVGNWQREATRFAPSLRVHVHHGSDRLSGDELARAVSKADLVLTTYSLVARDIEALSAVEWSRVVLDEAQNVKNSGARQTQAVRRLPARQKVALTGTPVENRLAELWSIMEFLNPGLLGSERAFRERFAVPVERYGDDEAADLLRRVTGPFVLRRMKTDKSIIADLPEKLEMKVYCNLTREQATLYQAVVDDMLARIEESEGMARRGLVLATMLKLKQVCNHPAQFQQDGSRLDGRSGKLSRLVETLEEVVAEGDRALVFTQFAEMGTMLHDHIQDRLAREVLWLHGGTPKRARDDMVARFQSDDGPSVFVLSIKAGGTGLNLTAANHVVHFDRWWNPAVEDQATDRAFRIGQRRNVQVRKLVCVGTLEERIDEMIEQKRALAERIVGTGEAWLTELSTDALRELVTLSADAVAEE